MVTQPLLLSGFGLGLSSAPRIFTRICNPLLARLRGTFHIKCSMYIGDIIVISKSHDGLLESLEVVTNLLTSLGFRINREKFVTMPSRIAKHLGY